MQHTTTLQIGEERKEKKKLYHPHKLIRRLKLLVEVCAMAQRTVKLVLQVPFIQTIFMEDMQAFEVSNDLGGEDGFEADGTGPVSLILPAQTLTKSWKHTRQTGHRYPQLDVEALSSWTTTLREYSWVIRRRACGGVSGWCCAWA